MDLTTQCVGLNPTFNTPVKLFLRDVMKLEAVLQSKILFSYNNHPVNRVDIFGVVTEIKRKENALQCAVDDGTGSVYCFLPIREELDPSIEDKLSKAMLKRCKKNRTVDLGDIVHVVGILKRGLWSDSIYVTNCNFEVIEDNNQSDSKWLEHIQSQVKLYGSVYNKRLALDKSMKSAVKTLLVKEAEFILRPVLKNVLKDLLLGETSTFSATFYGFEILDLPPVQSAISKTCDELKPKFKNNQTTLNQSVMNLIGARALAGALHFYVQRGNLFKKKCLMHEAITRNEQLDATYFITTKCTKLLMAIKEAVDELKAKHETMQYFQVVNTFKLPEFKFIKDSQYSVCVVEVAMDHLAQTQTNN